MNSDYYLKEFRQLADQLDKAVLARKQLRVTVGIFLDSVALKIYKEAWASPGQNALTAESRIFFSIWINDRAIGEGKVFYNIHALKLRQLKGYTVESRKFADLFRQQLAPDLNKWPNISCEFGPATLMQGWIALDHDQYKGELLKLARNFLSIEHLIDESLAKFRKPL